MWILIGLGVVGTVAAVWYFSTRETVTVDEEGTEIPVLYSNPAGGSSVAPPAGSSGSSAPVSRTTQVAQQWAAAREQRQAEADAQYANTRVQAEVGVFRPIQVDQRVAPEGTPIMSLPFGGVVMLTSLHRQALDRVIARIKAGIPSQFRLYLHSYGAPTQAALRMVRVAEYIYSQQCPVNIWATSWGDRDQYWDRNTVDLYLVNVTFT